jgi:hypothetical protein
MRRVIVMRSISMALVSLVVISSVAGCSSDAGYDSFIDKIRSCGALSSGKVAIAPSAPGAGCFYSCLSEGSCEDVVDVFCFPDEDSALLRRCVERCAFTCDSGDQIGLLDQCDGTTDCADGSDELDCGHWLFSCGDGDRIAEDLVCDGTVDCGNGRDEDDCDLFDCGGGPDIVQVWVCDGEEDCDNGSDEAGCADAICG